MNKEDIKAYNTRNSKETVDVDKQMDLFDKILAGVTGRQDVFRVCPKGHRKR